MGDPAVLCDPGQPRGIARGLPDWQGFLAAVRRRYPGDNISMETDWAFGLSASAELAAGATVFACWVDDPERYGVMNSMAPAARRGSSKTACAGIELRLTGLFFTPACRRRGGGIEASAGANSRSRTLTMVPRTGELHVERFGRGYAWLDAGHRILLEASQFIHIVRSARA